MIPTLHIEKYDSGMYRAILEHAGQPMFEEEIFSSVAAAVFRFGLEAPDDFVRFMDVRYCGYCIGTVSTTKMVSESETLARDLMRLYAAVAASEEEIDALSRAKKIVLS